MRHEWWFGWPAAKASKPYWKLNRMNWEENLQQIQAGKYVYWFDQHVKIGTLFGVDDLEMLAVLGWRSDISEMGPKSAPSWIWNGEAHEITRQNITKQYLPRIINKSRKSHASTQFTCTDRIPIQSCHMASIWNSEHSHQPKPTLYIYTWFSNHTWALKP